MSIVPEAATTPPPSRREEVTETLHGVEITDPYRWLEDQQSPETRAWLEAQIAHTHAVLDAWPKREQVHTRLTELMKVDTISIPSECDGTYFFSRRQANEQQAIFYRRKGLQGADEILIDPSTLSADKTTSIYFLDIAADASLLAYAIREGGEDEVTVHLLEPETGRELPDVLPKARYFGVSLKADRSGFYYAANLKDGPRVSYHAMGTDPGADIEIFGAGYGPEKIIACSLSSDRRYLLLTVLHGSAGQKTELHLLDIEAEGPVRPIVADTEARFNGIIVDDSLYIQTNWEAPNGRLFKTDVRHLDRAQWQEIVPTRPDAVLQSVSPVGGKLFLNYLQSVNSRIVICDPEGQVTGDLPLPGPGSAGGPYGRWNNRETFFTFTSFATPFTIYRYDTETGAQEIWAKQEIPIASERIVVRQVYYPSKDGTQIPMFLVHDRDLPRDGARPVYLTGYGGFNVARTPGFSALAALWAEKGGIYVVANLRGGGEFGEEWHQAGMLARKQNVFDDFIAAAEWLIAEGYTCPAHLAIAGGSNGGLLVGAALTQRPELFSAVVCAVPLLDMLRYHHFLVAGYWVPEYGSSEDPEQFKTLYAYSPYHHVVPGTHYPAVLFVTGDADTRVAPLHARKMTALLQTATASERPILLHYNTRSGHAGGKPIDKAIQDTTDELVFLFQQLEPITSSLL